MKSLKSQSTKLHIVFYLLQIISLLMSSVQKLPPEVSQMLCSQFDSNEIHVKYCYLHLSCSCSPLQQSHSFFKLLSMLTEMQGGPPGMPSFTNLTLARIWEVRFFC